MKKPVKAYNNTDFLNSPDARTLRILAEYLEPNRRFRDYNIKDTIVFFGSARIIPPDQAQKNFKRIQAHIDRAGAVTTELAAELRRAETALQTSRYYADAVALASMITRWSQEIVRQKKKRGRRFIVCSGGGPGIMEAANRGASEAGDHSIGLNISLPFEQQPNPFVTDELMFEFHYFFIRKFWFVYLAKALVVFPGGFGTIDEMMEVLTLVQTKKIKKEMPVVIYGTDFWSQILNFERLVEFGMIDREDTELFHFSDTPQDAFDYLTANLNRFL